jgi:glycosyltransferase involved in cell wall biosynthesis
MKINKRDIFFIIPAYNEAGVIYNVVNQITSSGYRVIVIDDHSSDDTSKVSSRAGAITLKHPMNLGQGASLQTGIEYALIMSAKIIVTFDADGQHRLEDAEKMIYEILKNNYDIVLGSRFLKIKPKNIPISRKILLKLALVFTRLTTGMQITDVHNGLRVFTRDVAKSISIKQNRMAHASEILHQLKNFKYKEIPVKIKYTQYSLAKGQKSLNFINILKDLFFGLVK